VQREVPSEAEAEGLYVIECNILKRNNPSVACGDSSLYTREPYEVSTSVVKKQVKFIL